MMRVKFDKPFSIMLTNGNPAPEKLHGTYDLEVQNDGWFKVYEIDELGATIPQVIANIHVTGFVAT